MTGGFTLVAAVLGFVGTSLIQARARSREERAEYSRLINEAMSAAEEVAVAVQMFAAEWGMLRFSNVLVRSAMRFTPGSEIWKWFFSNTDTELSAPEAVARMISTFFLGVSMPRTDSDDSRYLQLVFPALQRLRAALIPLRLGKDPIIAQAALELTEAAQSLGTGSRLRRRKYNPARKEWVKAFEKFRTVAYAKLGK